MGSKVHQRHISKKKLMELIDSFCDAAAAINLESETSETFTLQFARAIRALRLIPSLIQLLVPENKQARRHFRLKYTDSRLLRWTGVEQWRLIFWVLDGLNRDGLRPLAQLAERLSFGLQRLIHLTRETRDELQKVRQKTLRFHRVDLSQLTQHLARLDEDLSHFELQEVLTRNHTFLYSMDQLDCIQEMAILYSDAFQWAMYYGIFTLEEMEESSVEVMVGLPRLALLLGIRVLHRGPVQPSCPKWGEPRYPVLFEAYRRELDFLWRQLWCLSELEFVHLAHCVCQVNQCERDYWVFLPPRWRKWAALAKLRPPGSDGAADMATVMLDVETAAENGPARGRRENEFDVYLANLTPVFKVVCRVADSLQSEHANANRLIMQAVHQWLISSPEDETSEEEKKKSLNLADSLESADPPPSTSATVSEERPANPSSSLDSYLKKEFDSAFLSHAAPQLPSDLQPTDGNSSDTPVTKRPQDSLSLNSAGGGGAAVPTSSNKLDACPESASSSADQYISASIASSMVEMGVDALEALRWDSSESHQEQAKEKSASRLLSLPSFLECRSTAPEWQEDGHCDECSHCQRDITLNVWLLGTRRKHHCRRCGYIFCSSCWGGRKLRRYLPTLGLTGLQPVCVDCAEVLPPLQHSLVSLPLAQTLYSSANPPSASSPEGATPASGQLLQGKLLPTTQVDRRQYI